MTPLVDVLTRTTEYFRSKGIPSARLDAELILAHVLGIDRVKVYLNFDRPMQEPELETIRPLVRRRGAREPLAHVLGEKEFYGHDFVVTPGVLVPRPDTEAIVEAALALIPAEGEEPVYVADIGCGSGCIGLTVAIERPRVRLYAIDKAPTAVACTKANVEKHGLRERVAVRLGDGLAAVPSDRPLDWVLSNPPYIPAGDIPGLAPEIREHEPRLALDGGADGLDAYRALVPQCRRARLGALFEVGDGQADAVAALLEAQGFVTSRNKDLTGVERVVVGRRPEKVVD